MRYSHFHSMICIGLGMGIIFLLVDVQFFQPAAHIAYKCIIIILPTSPLYECLEIG